MINDEMAVKEELEDVRRELTVAYDNFNYAVDKDMVDNAIYRIIAAEKKYAYLIKYAKEKGYRETIKQVIDNE